MACGHRGAISIGAAPNVSVVNGRGHQHRRFVAGGSRPSNPVACALIEVVILRLVHAPARCPGSACRSRQRPPAP